MPIPDVPVRGRPGSSSRPKLPPTAVGTTPLHSPHVTARPVAPVASLHVLSRPSASHHALSLHRSCLVPFPHVLSRPLTSLHVTTRNVRSPSRPFAPLHVPPRPLHFTSLHFAPLHVGPTLLSLPSFRFPAPFFPASRRPPSGVPCVRRPQARAPPREGRRRTTRPSRSPATMPAPAASSWPSSPVPAGTRGRARPQRCPAALSRGPPLCTEPRAALMGWWVGCLVRSMRAAVPFSRCFLGRGPRREE